MKMNDFRNPHPLFRSYAYFWCLFYCCCYWRGHIFLALRRAFHFLARHTRLHLCCISRGYLWVYRVDSSESLFEEFLSKDVTYLS